MLIHKGSSHRIIKAWQTFLLGQGFNKVDKADGFWGPNTKTGTQDFQRANGLKPDGLAGPHTLKVAAKQGFLIPKPSPFNPTGQVNAVFDISHHNNDVDFGKAQKDGMMAVFHKASESTTGYDPKYSTRRIAAKAAGLLWGAYHFATKHYNGIAQADNFLAQAKPDGTTLLVLDFERYWINNHKVDDSMTLAEGKEFINRIIQKTGKCPVVYGGSYLKLLFRHNAPDPVFTQCPLWVPEYGSTVRLPNGWDNYAFWQFTDGKVGPGALPIDGVGHCDRDVFNGTATELRAFWAKHSV